MREKVLIGGDTATSKTTSLLQLSNIYPDSKIVIFDPDDGLEKAIYELELEDRYTRFSPEIVKNLGSIKLSRNTLPAISVIPVTPDWIVLLDTYKMFKAILAPEDWLCFDMMNRLWDFAQNFFSKQVYGTSPADHLLKLREQAKNVNFGGFDGTNDWTVIKRLHNEELVDDALLWSNYNVMATTSITSYLPVEKIPKTGIQGVLAKELAIKLEGEKHNVYRFDTIIISQKKLDGTFYFRIIKDRGRDLDMQKEYPFTGSSIWQEYLNIQSKQ